LKIFVLIFYLINTLSACAVCYGAPDDPVTLGMNKAILFLLGVIVFVLSCVSYGIFSLVRRSNQIKVEDL
tara:strand:- start:494 stop:703 length:210 start_codon:yes stop_codon:yes gene_type:complete